MNVAVIGCGRMGARRARTVVQRADTALAAVADVDPARAEALAAELHCAWERDVEAVVSRDDVDTVFVCSPNALHVHHAVAALEAGKHVVCEKPLATNPVDASMMVAAAERNGVTLKVGANLRFFANVMKAVALVRSGRIGEPRTLRGWIGNNGWPAGGWFADPVMAGGGTILDNGCHLFDLTRRLLGDMSACMGTTASVLWDIAVEDNGVGVFTSDAGRLAIVQASWTEWTTYFSFDVHGTDGVVTVDNRLPAECTRIVTRDGVVEEFDFAGKRNDTYALELEDYVAARRENRVPEPTGFDGLKVVEMAHAVYRSAAEGRMVPVR